MSEDAKIKDFCRVERIQGRQVLAFLENGDDDTILNIVTKLSDGVEVKLTMVCPEGREEQTLKDANLSEAAIIAAEFERELVES